jgi:hypothetical protein
MEKKWCSAYYWLRVAEENSRELRQRTRALTEKLKSKIRAEELETLEHSVMAAVEHNKRLNKKRPVEFIKRSAASASLRVAIWGNLAITKHRSGGWRRAVRGRPYHRCLGPLSLIGRFRRN